MNVNVKWLIVYCYGVWLKSVFEYGYDVSFRRARIRFEEFLRRFRFELRVSFFICCVWVLYV